MNSGDSAEPDVGGDGGGEEVPWQGVLVDDLRWCGLPPVVRGREITFGDFDTTCFPLRVGDIVVDAGGPFDVHPRNGREPTIDIRAVGVVVRAFADGSDVLILQCRRNNAHSYEAGTVHRVDADCTWLLRDDAVHRFAMNDAHRRAYYRQLESIEREAEARRVAVRERRKLLCAQRKSDSATA